jgi:hypothetical protein
MTLTPSGQIAAVVLGTIVGALFAGKTNRLLGAIGGGTLGLVVPYVIWPPSPSAPISVSSYVSPTSFRRPPIVMTPQVSPTPQVLAPVSDTPSTHGG